MDMSLRDLSIEELLSPNCKKSSVKENGKTREKVEIVLMEKHAKSQARIKELRQKQEAKARTPLQLIPKINKVSKEIAFLRESQGKNESTGSSYANRIITTARSSFAPQPKQSFLALADLEAASDLQSPNPKSLKSNPKLLKTLEKSDFEIKHPTLNQLRLSLSQRKNLGEPEEPQKKLLNMSVLQRNEFWLEKKNQKILQEKEDKARKEVEKCTFSPAFAPRLSVNSIGVREKVVKTSYSAKYLGKGQGKPALPLKKQRKQSGEDKKVMVYKALSPHKRHFSLGQSENLLKNAVPMTIYRT